MERKQVRGRERTKEGKKTERKHCWPVQKWPRPGCSFPQEPLRHRPPALLPGCPQCCHRDLASPSRQTGVGWTPAEKNHHHQNHCNSHRYEKTPVFFNHPVHGQHGPEVSIFAGWWGWFILFTMPLASVRQGDVVSHLGLAVVNKTWCSLPVKSSHIYWWLGSSQQNLM